MAIDNIDELDKLNTGRIKLNQAIDQANTVQGQLDTIVLESGTSDAEVIQARGDEPLLYNRLDGVDTQLAEIVQIAKWVNGIDDTTSVQNAINLASTTSHKVKLEPNKIYMANTLIPKENVEIDLNGSTLKLINGTGIATSENPLFSETSVKEIHYKNFTIKNGTLDGNNFYNKAGNASGGIVWLRNWDNITFEDLFITKAFRIIFNILGCENVTQRNITCIDNGLNVGGFFCYGASFEQSSKRITIDNFKIDNMYGYGFHFFTAENAKVDNIDFNNLNISTAIGITLTQAKNIELSNIKMTGILGDNLECNASENVVVNNLDISNAGKSSLVMGANNTGINNKHIIYNNVKMIGTTSAFAMKINYADNVQFNNCIIDKMIATVVEYPSSNVNFNDCTVEIPFDNSFLYQRFRHKNTQFTDMIINNMHQNLLEISNIPLTMVISEVFNFNLTNFAGTKPTWAGELTVLSQFTGSANQSTLAKYLVFMSGATMTMIEVSSLNGSLARKVTVTVDSTNKTIIFTNSTGVAVDMRFNFKCF